MKKMNKFSLRILFFILCVFALPRLAVADTAVKPNIVDPHYKAVVVVKDTPFAGFNGGYAGSDGNVYFANFNTIKRIDPKTMKISTVVTPQMGASFIDDLTSDGEGNFYFTSAFPLIGEVYRVDKNGTKKTIAKDLKAPNGIQYNKRTGRLFVSECFWGSRVLEVDPEGVKEPRVLVNENVIHTPEGFDFDRDTNDLIIPDLGKGKILRVNPDTGDIKIIAENFQIPVALKVGPDNMAYVIEMMSGAVYRVSLDGSKREKLAQLTAGLDNLAVTEDKRLFVSNWWEATVYELSTDGSGKFKALFPKGHSQISGIVYKDGKLLMDDMIMIRSMQKGKFVPTKLSWFGSQIPAPCSLADGPGNQVIWTDWVDGSVGMGNPFSGEKKLVIKELNRPMAAIMSKTDSNKVYVTETGAGQVTEVNIADGTKNVLATGFEGPVALAIIGDILYVGETKAGRISSINLVDGNREVCFAGVVGKVQALADDGKGNLLALDSASGRLLRINPVSAAYSVVAEKLNVKYFLQGSSPKRGYIEWPLASMTVSPGGDIYIPTADRGVIMLKKIK